MARRVEEFYCHISGGGCGVYFLTYLRTSMWGNYSIICPKCNHVHYRFVNNGLVTDDRHDKRAGEAEMIVGLKSTLRDTPYSNEADFRQRQLMLYSKKS